jgi:hypothetical protein
MNASLSMGNLLAPSRSKLTSDASVLRGSMSESSSLLHSVRRFIEQVRCSRELGARDL